MRELSGGQPSLVSVVLPVYNAASTLQKCVESILTQTYPHLEVLAVDDGSTDESLSLLRALAERDPRLRVFSQPNQGVAAARNLALDNAGGRFIQFVDSDDALPPTATAALTGALEGRGCDLAIGRYHETLLRRRWLRGHLKADQTLTRQGFLGSFSRRPNSFYYAVLWNKLYRREIIAAHGIRCDPSLAWGEDFAFNTRYLAHAASVAVLEESVYEYTRNPRGLSVTTGARVLLHPLAAIRLKCTLYRYYTRLFQAAGLRERYRFILPLYLFGVTLSG